MDSLNRIPRSPQSPSMTTTTIGSDAYQIPRSPPSPSMTATTIGSDANQIPRSPPSPNLTPTTSGSVANQIPRSPPSPNMSITTSGSGANQIPRSPPAPTPNLTTTASGSDAIKCTLENMANLLKDFTFNLQRHFEPKNLVSGNGMYDTRTKHLTTENIEQWFGKMDDRLREEQWARFQQKSPIQKSSSQLRQESERERAKRWKLENISMPYPDNAECCGMTIEHIRTKGALYGPEAVSAVGGVLPRVKRNTFDRPTIKKTRSRSFDIKMKTTKTIKPVMPPPPSRESTPRPRELLWESSKTISVSQDSNANTSTDFIIGKSKGIGRSSRKKSEDDITDEAKSKVKPIGWQSNMNGVGSGKEDSPLRYLFANVTSGRKSTFLERSGSDHQFQKVTQTLELKRTVPVPIDILVGDKSYLEKVNNNNNNSPTDSWYKRGKGKGGNGKRRGKGEKPTQSYSTNNNNKARKTRKGKGSTEQKPSSAKANETIRRLLGPKIEGINSQLEIYGSPHPSMDNLLDSLQKRIIRTVVLPTPRPKYMHII